MKSERVREKEIMTRRWNLFTALTGLLLLLAVPQSSFSQTYTFTSFSYPADGGLTWAYDINDNGQIVGSDASSTISNGTIYSFQTDDGGVTFSPIIYPLDSYPVGPETHAVGINNSGQIVGHYFDQGWGHNFLKTGETYSLICDGSRFFVNGINDNGQIVGQYTEQGPGYKTHGFVGDISDIETLCASLNPDSASVFQFPGAAGTVAIGINNSGQIVGNYYSEANLNDVAHGFLKNGDSYTDIEYPGHPPIRYGGAVTGINDSGQIVGYYLDIDSLQPISFVTDGVNYTEIVPPEGWNIKAIGINNSGQIVGFVNIPALYPAQRAFIATPAVLTPPPAPTLSASPITAVVGNNFAISGTAAPWANVSLFDGANSVGNIPADGSGNWSTQRGFIVGSHTLTATQSSGSQTSGPSLPVTVHVLPPSPSINGPTSPVISATQPATVTLTGGAFYGAGQTPQTGGTVTIFEGATQLGTAVVQLKGQVNQWDGQWSTSLALVYGQHSLTASQTLAGETSALSAQFTVTVSAPLGPTLADLAIANLTASPSPRVTAGSNITYTINFVNNGPDTPGSTSVSDTTPPGTKLVSMGVVSGTGWNVIAAPPVNGTGNIIWRKGGSPYLGLGAVPGETAQFEIVVSVDSTTPNDGSTVISNMARAYSIDSNSVDGVPVNNSKTVTTTVGVPQPPPFSLTPTGLQAGPDGACICTPFVMSPPSASGTQNWFMKADGSGHLTLTVIGLSVSPEGSSTAKARIFDPTGNLMTIDAGGSSLTELTAFYDYGTPGGEEVSASGTITTSPGTIYRVEVSLPSVGMTPASSYRLKFLGAQEAGINSPSFSSFIGSESGASWLFNVASGEDLKVRIFNGGMPFQPDPNATETFRLVWISPLGTIVDEQSFTTLLSAGINQTVSPPDATLTPGIWTLSIRATGSSTLGSAPSFYRLQRTSGTTSTDRGIYLNWYTAGEANGHLRIVDGNGQPFTGTVQATIRQLDGTADVGSTNAGALDGSAASGPTTIEITPPEGYTAFLADGQTLAASQTIDITCGDDVTVTFVVKDVTPPVIGTVTASPAVLGLANHQMVSIELGVPASDNVTIAPACRVVSVTSNEPLNGSGDGNTSTDYTFSGVGLNVSLRAERAGTLTDRIYTVAVVCRDAAGNDSLPTAVAVVVPHDQGKK
jgi:uncharacterized repeat protein (TIGR01451 family)